jgi:signal transduction histidine kinase
LTLFDEFSRFDAAGVQGSDIGLAISERIARALDAALTVNSSVGDASVARPTTMIWLARCTVLRLGERVRFGTPPAGAMAPSSYSELPASQIQGAFHDDTQ